MMDDLRELYQEVILDHSKRPRNYRELSDASHVAKGHNPLCGDRLTLYLDVDDETGTIRDVAFQGAGCAISTASASMMTEALKGKTADEAETIFRSFHGLVTGQREADAERSGTAEVDEDELGKLSVFAGVREFPVRVKCATLAWHTLKSALARETEAASTE